MAMGAGGQVTIPLEIREKLGLHPDTEVEFELDGDSVRVRKTRRVTAAPTENPPTTGAGLVAQWEADGVIGCRPDIADPALLNRRLRTKAERRDLGKARAAR
jgi:AbrB family looped-hinge helix DNA binding protein